MKNYFLRHDGLLSEIVSACGHGFIRAGWNCRVIMLKNCTNLQQFENDEKVSGKPGINFRVKGTKCRFGQSDAF